MLNKNRTIKIVSATALLALTAGIVSLAGNSLAEQQVAPAVSRPALTVRTTMLHDDKWARSLSANGSIMPWQEAIISAQVQGLRIAEVNGQHRRSCAAGRCVGDVG